jgi:hypothetical protein
MSSLSCAVHIQRLWFIGPRSGRPYLKCAGLDATIAGIIGGTMIPRCLLAIVSEASGLKLWEPGHHDEPDSRGLSRPLNVVL